MKNKVKINWSILVNSDANKEKWFLSGETSLLGCNTNQILYTSRTFIYVLVETRLIYNMLYPVRKDD